MRGHDDGRRGWGQAKLLRRGLIYTVDFVVDRAVSATVKGTVGGAWATGLADIDSQHGPATPRAD